MKKSIRGTVFILMVLAPMVLFNQQTLKKLGQWGSAPFTDIVVNGNYAYCAAGYAGLEILDISDREHPARVAGIETSSRANYICFDNGFIYVSVSEWGGQGCLEIIDVHDPLNPIGRGKMNLEKGCGSIAVQGRYVYLNMGTIAVSGLAIINVSNPDLPVQAGFVSGDFGGICVRDHYVYAVIEKGFAIVDVSNPSAPIMVCSKDYGHLCGQIKLKGNCVFLGGDFDLGSDEPLENWFAIINISNPAAPRVVSERRDIFRRCLCVIGDYIFFGGYDLDVVDISNLSSPANVNSLNFYNNILYEMVSYGQYLYAATYKGLVIFSIADPRNPKISGIYDMCGPAESVWAFDQKVCLAQSYGGLRILDVSNPLVPKLEWTYKEFHPSDDWNQDTVRWGMIRGHDAHIIMPEGNWVPNSWKIVDMSDPLHPFIAWQKGFGNYEMVGRLQEKDRFVYAGIFNGLSLSARDRIEIYDMTDPHRPVQVSNVLLGDGWYGAFDVMGNFSFIAFLGDLKVFDISDRSSPKQMASVSYSDNEITDLYVKYPYAYGVGINHLREIKLQIFSIFEPTQPLLLGSYKFGFKPSQNTDRLMGNLYVYGNIVYIAGMKSGLVAIDVSDPSHPKETASFHTPYMCDWVHGFGNRVYATDENAGRMYILEALDSPSELLLCLSVKRKSDRAWAFHPNYADLKITILNEDKIPVSRYLISRSELLGTYVVIKEISAAEMVANSYQYRDFGLINKVNYKYKVEALDAQGKVIAVSEEVTI